MTWEYYKVFEYYPALKTMVVDPIVNMITTGIYNIPFILMMMMQFMEISISLNEVHKYTESRKNIKVINMEPVMGPGGLTRQQAYVYKYKNSNIEKPHLLVFQAGNKVDHKAYAAFAYKITKAMKGEIITVLPKIKFGMAYIEPQTPNQYYEFFKDDISGWFLGGHSAGGSGSTIFKLEQMDSGHPLKGILLHAALPIKPMNGIQNFPIKIIAGSLDNQTPIQLIQSEEWQFANCPIDPVLNKTMCDISVIEGGIHNQFGWYASNFPTPPTTLTLKQQTKKIVIETKKWLKTLI